MDGTLINTESIHHKVVRQICEKYGTAYTKALELKLYGATHQKVCETLIKYLNLPVKPVVLEQELDTIGQRYMVTSQLQKGAQNLLLHLHANKIPLALATNATDKNVRLQMAAHPTLFEFFHHMVSISDPEVYRGKPYPDAYCVAASRFPAKPENKECLAFEDSPVGVEAAVAAGMQVVMIPDRRIVQVKDTRKATLVLPSLLQFQPELFGLPPFPKNHVLAKSQVKFRKPSS